MRVSVQSLVSSLIEYGSLTRAIDLQAASLPPLTSDDPIAVTATVEIRDGVVAELLERGVRLGGSSGGGRTVGQPHRQLPSRLHTGVLALLLGLDRPISVLGLSSGVVREYLATYGVPGPHVAESLQHVISLGYRRRLRSRPGVGRWHKARLGHGK